jgi:hypothetical protein
MSELTARVVLGFGNTEPLTREKIKDRQRALARLIHPDAGGATDAMQRLNGATSVLLQRVT